MNKLDFKSALYSIVSRCHVADSQADVLQYAQSRLKEGFWEKQTPEWQAAFTEACAELHRENRGLYTSVMRGF
jgi:hypothetical protein